MTLPEEVFDRRREWAIAKLEFANSGLLYQKAREAMDKAAKIMGSAPCPHWDLVAISSYTWTCQSCDETISSDEPQETEDFGLTTDQVAFEVAAKNSAPHKSYPRVTNR